ncbi:MAG: hypothetical protein KAJ19_26095 [Gammaproteobacteria bacterium]|nr:hypothetical protein [Gammaproteobacteria bacterium]
MKTIKTNKRVINQFGEMVKAKIIAPKYRGMFHKTECGEWVKKIHAIKRGLKLTGERKMFETPTQYALVTA